jgi:ParB/RepB/Spo0J family partition protein
MPKLNTSITTATDVSPRRQLSLVAIGDLIPDPHNPRKHGRTQIEAIARSIEAFGFNAPILVDKNNKIVAGHGRYEAAQLLGIDKVPVISLSDLTPTQAKAYLLADNKLTDRSTWDDTKLAIQLKELSDLCSTLTLRRSDLSRQKSICESNHWIPHWKMPTTGLNWPPGL